MTTLLTLNKHNKNGRIYHKDTMQAAIDKHLASNKPMMIEHPVEFPFHTPHVNIERCVGQVKNLQIEDNFLLGDISFFKDQEMYEGLSVVPKGIGIVSEDGAVTDYTLISFSLTNDPA